MNTFLFLLFIICSLIAIYFFVKYKKAVSLLESNTRQGYYIEKFTQTIPTIDRKTTTLVDKNVNYKVIYYVSEINKFTNGDSKIKLDNIEIIPEESFGFSVTHAKNFAITSFSTIKKESDINWTEIEKSLKDIRKEKLKKLKKLF